jgi:hypothetical protein
LENIVFPLNIILQKGDFITKCPKCGMEVSTPKKSWKMVGRKDKRKNFIQLGFSLLSVLCLILFESYC